MTRSLGVDGGSCLFGMRSRLASGLRPSLRIASTGGGVFPCCNEGSLSSPTAPKPQPRARIGSLLILLAITLVIYVGSPARPALLDDGDGCHALAAREILQRQDWTVLHINGIRWLEKPPLHYWLVAPSYLVFGESAVRTPLPIALAMVGLVLLLYEFGRRFFSERAGFYAGLVMSTSAGAVLLTPSNTSGAVSGTGADTA